ncbi:hypothetical protein [Abyssalbus ytuae]|uniref:Uncharacterized protein n=1 Tax=Abyssalbus ytuae TaxID=2926907 RepID=A0A9E7CTS6_9FLAO|nr:hypothetical protein [Abyssalbus ytuae]UOB18596.1 hypothetical protein MQE35_04730 [Abyssalbus ytuae]
MILSFMTKWPKEMPNNISGKLTGFQEKIQISLIKEGLLNPDDLHQYDRYTQFNGPELNSKKYRNSINSKKHTIRQDVKDRWRPCILIDFFVFSRTNKMFRFAPRVSCISTQDIEITYNEETCDLYGQYPTMFVDKRPLSIIECENLAVNDGFDSMDDFCYYFNKDYSGKIIHWTGIKY